MYRYCLEVEYIGTGYHGSQKQVNHEANTKCIIVKTIQSELEKAIRTLTKTNTKTIFAGRTDAGVHAKGQVVHFDTYTELNTIKFTNSVNGLLPKDISVKKMSEVSKGFHAQKSAIARHYRYVIVNRKQRSAWDSYCLFIRYPLNVERINKSLEYLKGEHDFTSFKKVKTNNPVKMCNMYSCKANKEGDYIFIDFIANRFLYNMVRAIVGTILLIEKNNLEPEYMKRVLELKDKNKTGATVSPEGLTLIEVIYDNKNGEIK